jgi:MFS transporter, FHS family, L-fucose permease
MNRKVYPVLLVFLCMGFGDAVGPFVGYAKDTFEVSNFVSSLIAFAGFIMFGVLSVPLGIIQDKKGKKSILLVGLIIALAGLIIPVIAELTSFEVFMITVLLLGAGAAILQVAGNPIMRDVSDEGKYSRNLTLGQFVKAIGSLSGPLLPVAAVLWFKKDWQIVFPVYSAALLLTLILVSLTKIREKRDVNAHSASFASCFKLLNNKYVLAMVAGIFLYVGAEVCMSSLLPQYLKVEFKLGIEEVITKMGLNIDLMKEAGVDIRTLGSLSTGFFFLGLMTGRFTGSVILNWISARLFLIITVLISLAGISGLYIVNSQIAAFIFIVIIGLGFANVFPLIFSIAIDAMPERTNELSGLMITAIVGGAFIPPLMGFIADKTSIMVSFIIPIACFLYLLWISVVNFKKTV